MKYLITILLCLFCFQNSAKAQDISRLTEEDIAVLYQILAQTEYDDLGYLSDILHTHFHDEYSGTYKVPFIDPLSGELDYNAIAYNKAELIETVMTVYESRIFKDMTSEIVLFEINEDATHAYIEEVGQAVMSYSYDMDRVVTFQCSDEVVLNNGVIQVLMSNCTESKPNYIPSTSKMDVWENKGNSGGGCKADKLINI